MNQKHYIDIERLKTKYAAAFAQGEHVVVQTKVDGSNASFTYDSDKNEIAVFSRKTRLNSENNLRGFYEWTQQFSIEDIKAITENGRYIVFGEWLCLSGDTVIKKASSGQALNTMTLKEMYEKLYTLRKDVKRKRGIIKLLYLLYEEKSLITKENFNTVYHLDKETTIKKALNQQLIVEKKEKYCITKDGISFLRNYYKKNSTWGHDGYPSIYSLNLRTDQIQTNKILDIVYTGKKQVYKLITHKGYSIKATLEHPFLTPKGWIPLKDLNPLDCVAITDFISRKKASRSYGKGTRAILKAQDDYKKKIGKCERCGSLVGLELHHIDENYMNNNMDNWQVLCRDCHKNIHTKTANSPLYEYEFDYVVSITAAGEEDCYDIAMEGDECLANFVANNFIVHNCKHTVRYPDNMYNNFYMFDVWDTEIEQYLPYEETYRFYEKLLNTGVSIYFVPVVYDGDFTSWEDMMSLLSVHTTGAEPVEEGIVIKSQDRLDNKHSDTPAYVKIVNEKFSEVHDSKPKKPVDPAELAAREAEISLIETIITERRVVKILEKAIDNGELRSDWDEKDMKWIAQNIIRAVYEDCLKEEPETVNQCKNFGKTCGSITMGIVRKMLGNR